jgi:hypothetical protein
MSRLAPYVKGRRSTVNRFWQRVVDLHQGIRFAAMTLSLIRTLIGLSRRVMKWTI